MVGRYTKPMKTDTRLVLGMLLVMSAIAVITLTPAKRGAQIASPTMNTGEAPAATVPFTAIASGSRSLVTTRVNYLITNEEELGRLWKLLDATNTPPTVDFKESAVIAVFAGEQPTAGYAIDISKVEDSGRRMVSVTLNQPGSGCVAAQVLSTPYKVVTLPVTSLPLDHEDTSTTVACSN